MATCKNYEINPYEYLVDVLTRLQECETDEDCEKLWQDGGLAMMTDSNCQRASTRSVLRVKATSGHIR